MQDPLSPLPLFLADVYYATAGTSVTIEPGDWVGPRRTGGRIGGFDIIDFGRNDIFDNKNLGAIDSSANDKLGGIEPGATKTRVFRQTTAPANAVNGDTWVDISQSPNITRVRNRRQLADRRELHHRHRADQRRCRPLATRRSGAMSAGDPLDLSDLDNPRASKLDTVQSNATRNRIIRQTGAPAIFDDGDFWLDGPVTKIRESGAWREAANYTTATSQLSDDAGLGAKASWGNVGGRPQNLSDLDNPRASKLDGVEPDAHAERHFARRFPQLAEFGQGFLARRHGQPARPCACATISPGGRLETSRPERASFRTMPGSGPKRAGRTSRVADGRQTTRQGNIGALADLDALDLANTARTLNKLPTSRASTGLVNSSISVDGNGFIQGIGTGAGKRVANDKITATDAYASNLMRTREWRRRFHRCAQCEFHHKDRRTDRRCRIGHESQLVERHRERTTCGQRHAQHRRAGGPGQGGPVHSDQQCRGHLPLLQVRVQPCRHHDRGELGAVRLLELEQGPS